MRRGAGRGARSRPPRPRPPTPNFRAAPLQSPRVPHLLLCLLRGAPPGWRCRRLGPRAPGRGSLRKTREGGATGTRRGRGRGRYPETPGWATRAPAGSNARRPPGQRGRPAGRRLAAGSPGRVARRAGGAAARLRAGPAPAPTASPRPGLPRPTSRPAPFVPVCCGDSSPGRAIPPAPLSPPGARQARGPVRPAARAGHSAAGPLGTRRGAASGREGMRAAGGGGWPVAGGGGGGGGARGGLFTCRGTSPCRYRTRS